MSIFGSPSRASHAPALRSTGRLVRGVTAPKTNCRMVRKSQAPRRPRNTKSCPEYGFSLSVVCANAARPSMPLRMSVTPAASHTRVPAGSAIMAHRALRGRREAPRHPLCPARGSSRRQRHTRRLDRHRQHLHRLDGHQGRFPQKFTPPVEHLVGVQTVTQCDRRHRYAAHERLFDDLALKLLAEWPVASCKLTSLTA